MIEAIHSLQPAEVSYSALIQMFDRGSARYRVIHHPAEGRTVAASLLRGHPLDAAAKSMVVRVRRDRRTASYVLAVVPGDRRVDLDALCELFGGVRADFAGTATAERLSGCVSGTIIPFSFHEELELIVDPSLLGHREIFFNLARLDRSVALSVDDYMMLAQPRIEYVSLSPALASA